MTMRGKGFEEILEECLERVQNGVPVEECLRDYPEEAPELGPLLLLASGMSQANVEGMSPEARARGRQRFDGAVRLHFQEQQAGAGSPWWMGRWVRPVTAVAASFAVFVMVGGGAFVASADSMPDQPLYSLKRFGERVRLSMAGSPEAEASLRLDLADRRTDEITYLARNGKAPQIAELGVELGREIQMASVLGLASSGGVSAQSFDNAVPEMASSSRASESSAASGSVVATEPGDGGITLPFAESVQLQPPASDIPAEAQEFMSRWQEQAMLEMAMIRLHYTEAEQQEVREALNVVLQVAREHYSAPLAESGFAESGRVTVDPRNFLLRIEGVLQEEGDEWWLMGRQLLITEDSEMRDRPRNDIRVRIGGLMRVDGSIEVVSFERAEDSDVAAGAVEIEGVIRGIQSLQGQVLIDVGGYRVVVGRQASQGFLEVGRWAHVEGTVSESGTEILATMVVVSPEDF